MPQVFDNIDQSLLAALQAALSLSDKADFCVGYFNLRGWKELDKHIRHWSETEGTCRLLVGMQKPPQDQLREVLSLMSKDQGMDNQSANRLKLFLECFWGRAKLNAHQSRDWSKNRAVFWP